MSRLTKHFPYKNIRPAQEEAINFAIDEFEKGKKYVIIEAGTGVGKSAIAWTISNYFDFKTYFITTQKILQDQYVRDFGKDGGIKSIKSATNYYCHHHKAPQTCAEGLRALKASTNQKYRQEVNKSCRYKQLKRQFIANPRGVTNFPYFLAETFYSGQLEPRELLVIDEAHNIESELSKFVEISFSSKFAKNVLKVNFPEKFTNAKIIKWVKEVYYPKAKSQLEHMERMLEKYTSIKNKLKEFTNVMKQYEILDKHVCKITRFLEAYNSENWVLNIIENGGNYKAEFKPVDISSFTEKYLFRNGEKVLMMSATILNKDGFCESLGLSKEEVSFISLPSPFPKSNRPIMYFPIGSMSFKNINNSLPKLADAVREIINQHKNEKGIIHCHSYNIVKYLKENLKDKRILTHDSTNRDRVLWRHENGKQPTVLLSPSMSEGVDLKGDKARFQILCKVPYPYLGDKLVKKRMNKWKWWYPLQTAKTVVQSVGRSVRSMEDHAVTYILDSDWERFYNRNDHMFPKDFKKCLKR